MTHHRPIVLLVTVPIVATLVGLGAAGASASPAPRPPLAAGVQPEQAVPVTDAAGVEVGSVGMQFPGAVQAWWLEACSPSPAARLELVCQRHAREALCGSLAAVLGVSEQVLADPPIWGIDDAGGLWVAPLPPAAHARLLGVARSLPEWEIESLTDQGLRLAPATPETTAKRTHLDFSGGLFEGEEDPSSPAASPWDQFGSGATGPSFGPSVTAEPAPSEDTWIAGW